MPFGRLNMSVRGFPKGNWLGPTLFAKVKPKMSIYREEIFGPVLITMEAANLENAWLLSTPVPAATRFHFYFIGGAAREYQNRVEAGQVGVNLPIPVALPFFSFTVGRVRFLAICMSTASTAYSFYTRTKTITARWSKKDAVVKANMTIRLK